MNLVCLTWACWRKASSQYAQVAIATARFRRAATRLFRLKDRDAVRIELTSECGTGITEDCDFGQVKHPAALFEVAAISSSVGIRERDVDVWLAIGNDAASAQNLRRAFHSLKFI